MGTEITVFVNSVLAVRIHTSCSKPIGPGAVWGDFEVVSSTSRSGGEICPINCMPQVVTMRYTGESCQASNNSQDPRKAKCSGNPAFTQPVTEIASDKKGGAKNWFGGMVYLGDLISIDAANEGEQTLKKKTVVQIFDHSWVLQTVEFDTSGEQPLNVDDQFGSLVVKGLSGPGCEAPEEPPPGAALNPT